MIMSGLKPDNVSFSAVLSACSRDGMHKNMLDSEMTLSGMLLSNFYAACGRWKDSARVRVSQKTKGLRGISGQSWIEVK
ncbi:Pentatricopeptide repeat [Quillaja saponaria]|uniref:Pentatricopeptide repeat n=1 Tax=Quillaja saponaria TaxID=32244 RepID=A0AAD7PPK0_QUISA|nr:Pentatricopeptide repeat [Quillaja saponaria]